jgi:hypothetical protein
MAKGAVIDTVTAAMLCRAVSNNTGRLALHIEKETRNCDIRAVR